MGTKKSLTRRSSSSGLNDFSFSPTPNKRFNKILLCPSCGGKYGVNFTCVSCQIRSGQKHDIF